jgi:hypothetical protein
VSRLTITRRLIALVTVPLVFTGGFAAWALTTTGREAISAARLMDLVSVAQEAAVLADRLQDERAAATAVLVGRLPFEQLAEYRRLADQTDEAIGSAGGSNPTLNGSDPPDMFTGSSAVFDPAKLLAPRGFALSFSNWSPGLAITGVAPNATIASATADATGTFNATPLVTFDCFCVDTVGGATACVQPPCGEPCITNADCGPNSVCNQDCCGGACVSLCGSGGGAVLERTGRRTSQRTGQRTGAPWRR